MTMSGPSEILYGQSKIYKLTLANPGNGDAENVTVSLLPMGRNSEVPTSHRVGTIKAGLSKTIEVELTARQAGTLSIKAEALADGGLRRNGRTGRGAAGRLENRRARAKGEICRYPRDLPHPSFQFRKCHSRKSPRFGHTAATGQVCVGHQWRTL